MSVSVLREVEIDGHRISRRVDRVVLIALVAADGRPVSRRVLELIINFNDQRQAPDRDVQQALSRLSARAGDALVCERGGPVSLTLPTASTDLDRFELACDRRAIASARSSAARIGALRDAIAMCPGDLWADLYDFVSADPHYLRPQRDNLLRQRRAALTELTFELLRAGEVSAALAVKQEAAADEDWEYDPFAQLSVVHALWANGDHVEAKVVLNAIDRFFRNNQSEPGFDLEGVRDRIRRSVPWTVADLPAGLGEQPDSALGAAASAGDPPGRDGSSDRALPGTAGPLTRAHPRGLGADDQIESQTVSAAAIAAASSKRRSASRGGLEWQGRVSAPGRSVGRSHDLHHVIAAMRASSSRTVNPFVVKGPSGIGRSRFLDDVERSLVGMGWSVMSTRCIANYSRPLGTALDLLADADSGLAEEMEGDPSDPRFVVAVANELLRLASDTPCGLIIDDAHFADPASLAAFEVALARRTTGHPLWILLSHNLGGASAVEPQVEAAIRSIEADRRCEHVVLRPFTDREVSVVTEDMLGSALDIADCWSLVEVTQGRPANVVRAVFDLADSGLIRLDHSGSFLAESALSSVSRRSDLGAVDDGGRLPAALRLLGPDTRVGDLAAVLGWPETEVLEQLSELSACEVVGPHYERRVRFRSDSGSAVGESEHPAAGQQDVLDAIIALLARTSSEHAPDPETDACIARLCGVLDPPVLVDLRTRDLGGNSAGSAVTGHLRRHAERLQAAGGWVGAAKVWDIATVVSPDHEQSLVMTGFAGRCWLRGHDGAAAEERLTRAMRSSDRSVRGTATIDLCRTYSSILIMERPASAVIDLVEAWMREVAEQPDPVATDLAAELAGVAAERLSVDRRYDEARRWIARAYEQMRPECPSLTRGMVAVAAGVVEILAANHAAALAHFNTAIELAEGDGWLIAWCAARTLLCRAVVHPLDVRPVDVVQAKSLALGVLSWSDVLMTAVAATQVALVQRDVGWARAEIDEAIQTEQRANYALTAKGLRLLFAAATSGSLYDDGDGWLVGIGRTWALSQRTEMGGLVAVVDDDSGSSNTMDLGVGREDRAQRLLADITTTLEHIDADAEANYLDMWSVALVAIVADLLVGNWDELAGCLDVDAELRDLAKRALAHVQQLAASGEYAVLGVPVSLRLLAERLMRRM